MIVFDASVLVALLNRRDDHHRDVVAWYRSSAGVFLTSPLVLAETDALLERWAPPRAVEAFRRELASGAVGVEWWENAVQESVQVTERYPRLGLSLTDASLVALAARLETTSIATLDERHFRAVRPLTGEPAFTLLPADA